MKSKRGEIRNLVSSFPTRLDCRVVFLCALIAGVRTAEAGSATWDLNPTSNDWNTAANWTPETVPDQPTDVAAFDVSNVTAISVMTEFNLGGIVFNPGASAYTIAINENNPVGYIVFNGAGVVNNSGLTQNFRTYGGLGFLGTATAGSDVIYTDEDTGNPYSYSIGFIDHSNAGSATFINVGASGSLQAGATNFSNSASAADSTIINGGSDTIGGGDGFFDSSTAGNSTITTYRNGNTVFFGSATGGTATLIADGGKIRFEYTSTGGMARVELLDGGILDVSANNKTGPTTIGSLEGDSTGTVLLGARHGHQLTIGGNGLGTTYGGTVKQTGSLLKTGNESLTLTEASTYTGGTTIEGGTLLVQTSNGSATGTGPVQVNAGTFGGRSNILGAVTIGSGSGSGAFLAPGVKGPGTLAIKNRLTFKADGTYNYDLSLAQAKADQVSGKGVTIGSGAQFAFLVKGNQTLAIGTVFTVINNKSPNPISGVFANLADNSTFTAKGNNFQVSYDGGDGNDLTLTVVQ